MTPESAGWTYVGFELWRLRPGQSLAQATGEREACLVMVGGKADIAAGGQSWPALGERGGPFEGKSPCSVYVPWHERVPGHGRDRARARDLLGARRRRAIRCALIPPEAVATSSRGKGTNVRHVRDILPEGEPAHSCSWSR